MLHKSVNATDSEQTRKLTLVHQKSMLENFPDYSDIHVLRQVGRNPERPSTYFLSWNDASNLIESSRVR